MSAPTNHPPVAIASHSLITPLGRNAGQTWKSLLAGESCHTLGRIDIPPDPEFGRVEQLALIGVEQLLASAVPRRACPAVLSGEDDSPLHDCALIVGTSKGTVDAWLDRLASARTDAFRHEMLADVATLVARRFDIRGPRLTVSAACASSLLALIRGVLMIRSGEARRVLVLGVESSLHELFEASFKRLGVLAPDGICRPFDRDRRGFFLSEAVAAVLLEPANPPRRGGNAALPRVQVEAIALGADATHLTGSDPAGRALEAMIRRVLPAGGVDLVHAHATGTHANDPAELHAIDKALGGSHSIIYSHKGALGHTLGASGLVAVVLNCMAHVSGAIPGNVNLRDPLPVNSASLPRRRTSAPIHRSIALAAGFGGPQAAVCLRST